jgi:hypothetical protein
MLDRISSDKGMRQCMPRYVDYRGDIQETETAGKLDANNNYWKTWQGMQESGALAEYETPEIQRWKEQKIERLVFRDLEMMIAIQERNGEIQDENGTLIEKLNDNDMNIE